MLRALRTCLLRVCDFVCVRVFVWQKQKKTYVMLVQCSSDHGPQLAAALTGTGNDASRDKAIQQLTVIVENVFFELTEILVYCHRTRARLSLLLYKRLFYLKDGK